MAACRSCHAEIFWAEVEKEDGKRSRIPLDLHDRDDGNVVQLPDEPGLVKVFRNAEAAELAFPGERRFVSHFATCVHADEHRGRGRRR